MKKTLAIVLTLALLVTVAAPVFAAEDALQSFICPRCSGSAYEDRVEYNVTQYKSVTSCDAGVNVPHTHRIVSDRYYATCDDCGYEFLVTTYTRSDTCLG